MATEAPPNAASNGDTLHSWKEIAAYLRRDVRTVQRWEKTEGLPVHRLWHKRLGSVFAYKSELDAWWDSHRVELEGEEAAEAEALGDEATPRKSRKRLAFAAALLLVVAAAGFVAWRGLPWGANHPMPADAPAVAAPGTASAACSLPANLVSFWPGEDSAQDVQGENDGLELGGVGYVAAKQGMAFLLDGERSVVKVSHPPLKSEDFTVAAWVMFHTLEHPPGANTAGAPQGDMEIVGAVSNDYVNLDGWRLLKHDTQRFLFCLGGGQVNGCYTNGPMVLSKTTVAANTWYHVAATKSGNFLAIYVNGKLEMTTRLKEYRNSNRHELRIGSYLLQGAYLNGLVDEVMLFDRGLTAAEVQSVYQSTQQAACQYNPEPARAGQP